MRSLTGAPENTRSSEREPRLISAPPADRLLDAETSHGRSVDGQSLEEAQIATGLGQNIYIGVRPHSSFDSQPPDFVTSLHLHSRCHNQLSAVALQSA